MSKKYIDIKPFNKRKKPTFEYPNGDVLIGEILDEVEVEYFSAKSNKVYKSLVQKIRWDNGSIDYRFCYYINNLNDPSHKWVFSKNPLTLTQESLEQLMKLMREKGWI